MTNPSRARRRRWWIIAAALSLVLLPAAAFPWLLGTPPGRRWLLARANRALAPGRLDFREIRFSWFGPTRIARLVLVDRQGSRVIDAPNARWDRNLWQLLFERPRLGTVVLDRADLDIERRADRTINLYETLKPILAPDPRLDLTIVVDRGHLLFRSVGVPTPVVADRADVRIHFAPAPSPLTWKVVLANPGTAGEESLAIEGRYHEWEVPRGEPADLQLALKGARWPWSVEARGITARGRLDGSLAFHRRERRWQLVGDASLRGLDVTGPRLGGDQLRMDRLEGAWELIEGPDAWQVHRLRVSSPLVSITSTGAIPGAPESPGRIEGTLDLAALAGQLPHTLHLREGLTLDRGTARVRIDSRRLSGGAGWEVEARLSDLSAHDGARKVALKEPATLRASVEQADARLDVRTMSVSTAFLNATGQGDIDRGLRWEGTLDLRRFQEQFRDLVDFGGVEMGGEGKFSGSYRRAGRRFEGQLAAGLNGLKLAGIGPGTLERDRVDLRVSLGGAATESGLPGSWSELKAGLSSGTSAAELEATSRDQVTTVSANFSVPVTVGGRERKATGRVGTRWEGPKVSLDPVELGLSHRNPDAKQPEFLLAARGEYDSARGELMLRPIPGAASDGALALAPDGLRITGLGKPGSLRADGGFSGRNRALLESLGIEDVDAEGRWTAQAAVRTGDEGVQVAARFEARDLLPARRGEGAPDDRGLGLSLKGLYRSDGDRLELSELVAASPYATAQVSGSVADLRGGRQVDLKGVLTPDWEAVNRLLADRVEPRARLRGEPHPIRVKGSLRDGSAEGMKTLEAEVGLDAIVADLYGMRIGPTALVVRSKEGRLAIDPIDAAINEGRMHLEPQVVRDDGGTAHLRFGAESMIRGATINDEVSHRVLSFVAPVLESATRVHGKVSVAVAEADFPLGGGRGGEAKVEGQVRFEEVEFVPGPLVNDLFGLVGAERRPTLKLDEPVSLAIADRKVTQKGFAIPIGRATRIELAGWVDFDKNLALNASLPLTPAMVGNNGFLGDIVGGTRINVPIRGTLQAPEIDREAMRVGLKDLGKTLLERTAGRGAAELLFRMTRPRDPNEPPPLTPEQRREQRRQRREERRLRRQGGMPPDMP